MPKHGKKYVEAAQKIDPAQAYTPEKAMELVKATSFTKFDATVEVHLRMGVDPRHADQQVRAVASLPHGLGKTVRVLVLAQGEGVRAADEAGADFVGGDDLIKRIEGGWFDFDIAISTPDMMGKVGRLGKLLGRRGLMPNPKSGTVVPAEQLPRVIREARKGRVEFRTDRTALIHVPIGKVSFETPLLVENFGSLMDAIVKAKPSGAKGQYIRAITIASTMGPGIKIDIAPALALAAA
ncbi:MAG: 50S ribosomal protein L1 [Chloroflexi bacterium]|nr:50S ribosomal protein L1 [Chloroflexota bacterium]